MSTNRDFCNCTRCPWRMRLRARKRTSSFPGAGHGDVEQAPLLLLVALPPRLHQRYHPVLDAADQHRRELQPLGGVHRHQADRFPAAWRRPGARSRRPGPGPPARGTAPWFRRSPPARRNGRTPSPRPPHRNRTPPASSAAVRPAAPPPGSGSAPRLRSGPRASRAPVPTATRSRAARSTGPEASSTAAVICVGSRPPRVERAAAAAPRAAAGRCAGCATQRQKASARRTAGVSRKPRWPMSR